MLVLTVMLLTYVPLADAGLARTRLSRSDLVLSSSRLPSNDALPTGTCTLPALSTRYSTLPPFRSCTAWATSAVTVPTFGFGIRPRGPRILPSLPTTDIMSGVATALSNSSQPSSLTRLARSSPPTTSAPACSASCALSPLANTATRTDLPVPCGRSTVPRMFWSAFRGSTPSRTAISTVSSNFVRLVSRARSSASGNG